MFTGIVEEVGEVEAAVRRRDVLAVRIRARVDQNHLAAIDRAGSGEKIKRFRQPLS